MSRRSYSLREDSAILKYICANKLQKGIKGIAIWQQMEEKQVVRGRTWSSLKERFIKKILPNLSTMYSTFLTEEDFALFLNTEGKEENRTTVTSRTSYTKKDDLLILNYIFSNTDLVNVKLNGNAIWQKMETEKVTEHSYQSMRNRFLRTISCHLDRYGLNASAKRRLEWLLNSQNGAFFPDDEVSWMDHEIVSPVTSKPSSSRSAANDDEPTMKSRAIAAVLRANDSSNTTADRHDNRPPNPKTKEKSVNCNLTAAVHQQRASLDDSDPRITQKRLRSPSADQIVPFVVEGFVCITPDVVEKEKETESEEIEPKNKDGNWVEEYRRWLEDSDVFGLAGKSAKVPEDPILLKEGGRGDDHQPPTQKKPRLSTTEGSNPRLMAIPETEGFAISSSQESQRRKDSGLGAVAAVMENTVSVGSEMLDQIQLQLIYGAGNLIDGKDTSSSSVGIVNSKETHLDPAAECFATHEPPESGIPTEKSGNYSEGPRLEGINLDCLPEKLAVAAVMENAASGGSELLDLIQLQRIHGLGNLYQASTLSPQRSDDDSSNSEEEEKEMLDPSVNCIADCFRLILANESDYNSDDRTRVSLDMDVDIVPETDIDSDSDSSFYVTATSFS